jgi:hypothetical protein
MFFVHGQLERTQGLLATTHAPWLEVDVRCSGKQVRALASNQEAGHHLIILVARFCTLVGHSVMLSSR